MQWVSGVAVWPRLRLWGNLRVSSGQMCWFECARVSIILSTPFVLVFLFCEHFSIRDTSYGTRDTRYEIRDTRCWCCWCGSAWISEDFYFIGVDLRVRATLKNGESYRSSLLFFFRGYVFPLFSVLLFCFLLFSLLQFDNICASMYFLSEA